MWVSSHLLSSHLSPESPFACQSSARHFSRYPKCISQIQLLKLGLSTSCSATSSISSNFFILSTFSSYLLILRYRSGFQCLNWPFFHMSQCFSRQFMNLLWKKKPNPPPTWGRSWAQDKRRWAARSRRLTLDSLECFGWRRSFNNFIGSLHFVVLVEDKVI